MEEIKQNCGLQFSPILVLIRIKYENDLNPKKYAVISDEEALEYADKNNMHFFHIGINKKYETGSNESFEFVLNKYIVKHI